MIYGKKVRAADALAAFNEMVVVQKLYDATGGVALDEARTDLTDALTDIINTAMTPAFEYKGRDRAEALSICAAGLIAMGDTITNAGERYVEHALELLSKYDANHQSH